MAASLEAFGADAKDQDSAGRDQLSCDLDGFSASEATD